MQRSPHTGGATLGLTTPQQGVRSEWTTHFLAPRSYWAPFSYLQPSHPSGSSSLARSAHASWNGSPNPALHYVQSVVNSGLDGHPFPQFRGLREGPALRWPQISREDGNARCSQAGLPGLQNSIPPWLSPNPATRAPFSDWPRELVSCSPIQKTFRRLVLLWPRLRSPRIGWAGVMSRASRQRGPANQKLGVFYKPGKPLQQPQPQQKQKPRKSAKTLRKSR